MSRKCLYARAWSRASHVSSGEKQAQHRLFSSFLFLIVCRRLEYTREQLLEFKKQMDEKVHQTHGEEQGGGFGGFGGFGGGGSSEVS